MEATYNSQDSFEDFPPPPTLEELEFNHQLSSRSAPNTGGYALHKQLQKEIKQNARVGFSNLHQKSELDRALERRTQSREQKDVVEKTARTSLSAKLEERAKRLQLQEDEANVQALKEQNKTELQRAQERIAKKDIG